MINIRQKTFETNSSSMHSLVVVKYPREYTTNELAFYPFDRRKEYELFGYDEGDYGRYPFRVLSTPEAKMRYYVAHEIGTCEKRDLIPKVKEFLSKQTGLPTNKIDIRVRENRHDYYNRGKNDYYGYVEHNDTGESPFEYINKHNITMEDFVLNPKYVVIVDGDEYQEFKDLFNSRILNADDFEDISTGADFWNDAETNVYLDWIKRGFDETDISELVSRVNDRTKILKFFVYSSKDLNDHNGIDEEIIKRIIKESKERNPKIKTVFECPEDSNIEGLDLSLYDEIKKVKYNKYDD